MSISECFYAFFSARLSAICFPFSRTKTFTIYISSSTQDAFFPLNRCYDFCGNVQSRDLRLHLFSFALSYPLSKPPSVRFGDHRQGGGWFWLLVLVCISWPQSMCDAGCLDFGGSPLGRATWLPAPALGNPHFHSQINIPFGLPPKEGWDRIARKCPGQ